MAVFPAQLLTLIDDCAAAHSRRHNTYRTFSDSHRPTLAARDAVVVALGITNPAPLADAISLASDALAYEEVSSMVVAS